MKVSYAVVLAASILTGSCLGGVTDISIGTTIQKVNGTIGNEYESKEGEELYGYLQFLVDTNGGSDTVITKTIEMDGEVDEDFVYIPANSTDHPVLLTDTYTTANPLATAYDCCFSIPRTLFSNESHDGLCLEFTDEDAGAPGL